MMRRTAIALSLALISATPALGQVKYDIFLRGSQKELLILKIDTRKLGSKPIIQAPFTAVLTKTGGTVKKSYTIAELRPGRIYEWRGRHGVVGAKWVMVDKLVWAARVVGGKADGRSEDSTAPSLKDIKPTDIIQSY